MRGGTDRVDMMMTMTFHWVAAGDLRPTATGAGQVPRLRGLRQLGVERGRILMRNVGRRVAQDGTEVLLIRRPRLSIHFAIVRSIEHVSLQEMA